MRFWMSRGVPEWSGGEDRYIVRRVLESGSVSGGPGYGQHDRVVVMELVVLRQGFAKRYGGEGRVGGGRGCAREGV